MDKGEPEWVKATLCEGLFPGSPAPPPIPSVPPPSAGTSAPAPSLSAPKASPPPIFATKKRPSDDKTNYYFAGFLPQKRLNFRIYLGYSISALLVSICSMILMGKLVSTRGAARADYAEAVIYWGFASMAFSITSAVLVCIILAKSWRMLKVLPGVRCSPREAVGNMFIPFYNIYWIFVAWHGWGKDYDRLTKENWADDRAPQIRPSAFLLPLIFYLIWSSASIQFHLAVEFGRPRDVSMPLIYFTAALQIADYVLWWIAVSGMCKATNYLIDRCNQQIQEGEEEY